MSQHNNNMANIVNTFMNLLIQQKIIREGNETDSSEEEIEEEVEETPKKPTPVVISKTSAIPSPTTTTTATTNTSTTTSSSPTTTTTTTTTTTSPTTTTTTNNTNNNTNNNNNNNNENNRTITNSNESTTTTTTTTTTKIIKCNCKKLNEHTHTYCSTNCGCSKNHKQKCSIKCGCKGQCFNGNSIPEDLFFKVWRNKYIRYNIIGSDRLEKIRVCEERKEQVLAALNNLGISLIPDLLWITRYISYVDYSVETIVQKITDSLKSKRSSELSIALRKANVNHNDSELIRKYINTLNEKERELLPTLESLVEIEKQYLVNKRLDFIKLLQSEGLGEEIPNSTMLKQYLTSTKTMGPHELKPILDSIRANKTIEKKKLLESRLTKQGYLIRNENADIKKYLTVFKPTEIKAQKVKNIDEIVKQEIVYNQRRLKLINALAVHNLTLRSGNKEFQSFLNNDTITNLDDKNTNHYVNTLVTGELETMNSKEGVKLRDIILKEQLDIRNLSLEKAKEFEFINHYLNGTLKGTIWENQSLNQILEHYVNLVDNIQTSDVIIGTSSSSLLNAISGDDDDDNNTYSNLLRNLINRFNHHHHHHHHDSDDDDDDDDDEDYDDDDDDDEDDSDSPYYGRHYFNDSDEEDHDSDDSDFCQNCRTYH